MNFNCNYKNNIILIIPYFFHTVISASKIYLGRKTGIYLYYLYFCSVTQVNGGTAASCMHTKRLIADAPPLSCLPPQKKGILLLIGISKFNCIAFFHGNSRNEF